MSVEQRKERDLRKRFDEINIEWKAVENKLKAWNYLFHEGKKSRIDISFICKEAGQPAAMRTRSSATKNNVRRETNSLSNRKKPLVGLLFGKKPTSSCDVPGLFAPTEGFIASRIQKIKSTTS